MIGVLPCQVVAVIFVFEFFCGLTSCCCFGVGTLYVTRGVYLSLFITRILPGVFTRVLFLCVVIVFFNTRVVVGLVDVNTSFVVVYFCEVAIGAPLPVAHIRCNFWSTGVSGLILFCRNLAMIFVSLSATYSMSRISPAVASCCNVVDRNAHVQRFLCGLFQGRKILRTCNAP